MAHQKYEAEYTLKPGESKNLDIAASVAIVVGFKTDMKEKQMERNQLKNVNAIELSTRDGDHSISSWDRGELDLLKPINGIIAIDVKNQGDIPLRVVIYTTTKSK